MRWKCVEEDSAHHPTSSLGNQQSQTQGKGKLLCQRNKAGVVKGASGHSNVKGRNSQVT